MHGTPQLQGFNARIARIQDPKFKHVVDPESGLKIPRRITRDQVGKKPKASVMSIMMAFMLGMISLMGARYLQIDLINIQPYFPDAMIAELVLAGGMAFMIGLFMKMRSVRTMIAQLSGAAVCAVTMHNAVWFAPDQFALLFSQGYVDQVMSLTDPLSIYLNGTTYALSV